MIDLKDFKTGFKQSQFSHILETLVSLFQAASVLPSPFIQSLEGREQGGDYFDFLTVEEYSERIFF